MDETPSQDFTSLTSTETSAQSERRASLSLKLSMPVGAEPQKDSPLTDIGTSPPPFEIPSLGKRNSEYESSELSDLGDDESEAETDKMDFLDDDNSRLDQVSDLQALSELTELARLQGVDSDDSDDDLVKLKSASPEQVDSAFSEIAGSINGKRLLEPELDSEVKKQKLDDLKFEPTDSLKFEPTDSSTQIDISAPDISEPEPVKESTPEKSIEEADDEEPTSEPTAEPDGLIRQDKSELELEDEEEDLEVSGEADVEDTVKQEEQEEQEEQEAAEEAEEEEKNVSAEFELEDDVDLDEHRKLAVEELISIETDFAHLRDKLYQDKLSILEHELQLCLDGSHPELLQIYYKVNEFYQDNIKLANATLNYSLKCINTETIATRTAIHQDFLKQMMDMKNDMVTKTTSLWYKINKERNYSDQIVLDYNFTAMPTVSGDEPRGSFSGPAGGNSAEYYLENQVSKKTIKQNTLVELVQHRNNLNEQLGILNGLKEFFGVPCAVSAGLVEDDFDTREFPAQELLLRKATADEINDDLRAMGIH